MSEQISISKVEEKEEEPPINLEDLAAFDKVPEIDLNFVDEYKEKYPQMKVTDGLSGSLLRKLHATTTFYNQ